MRKKNLQTQSDRDKSGMGRRKPVHGRSLTTPAFRRLSTIHPNFRGGPHLEVHPLGFTQPPPHRAIPLFLLHRFNFTVFARDLELYQLGNKVVRVLRW